MHQRDLFGRLGSRVITTTQFEKCEIEKHVQAISARHVLEIGAFKGQTTRILADAVAERGGRVVVIDPMRWSSEILRNGIARHLGPRFPRVLAACERLLDGASYEDAFWRNVGGHGRREVVLHRELSSDPALLASTAPELESFDLVFVDGDHAYEGAMLDLVRWGSRVRKGGRVLVHDATPRFPGVTRALREWGQDSRLELEWPVKDSLCVVRVLEDRRSADPSYGRGLERGLDRAPWIDAVAGALDPGSLDDARHSVLSPRISST